MSIFKSPIISPQKAKPVKFSVDHSAMRKRDTNSHQKKRNWSKEKVYTQNIQKEIPINEMNESWQYIKSANTKHIK